MKRIHIMGIEGSGAQAFLGVAAGFGYEVSGCDVLTNGHNPSHIADIDILVLSPAILAKDPTNAEIASAKRQHIPVMTWPQFVGEVLQKEKFVIAIAGTHGKSTTTAILGLMLEKGGLDPTVIVGATVKEWGKNFRVGQSKYFVIEADEYGDSFLHYKPDIAVVTVVEYDHPEYFADEAAFKKSFERFVGKIKTDGLVMKGEDITEEEMRAVDKELQISGWFNRKNAALAVRVAKTLHVSDESIRSVLRSFTGALRRFEIKGEKTGVMIIDDYAHHPTEVRETLKAGRERFPDKRIFVVFQPHMFTRTKVLWDDFVSAFRTAPIDGGIILDIFPSREQDPGNVKSEDLVQAISRPEVEYRKTLQDAVLWILEKARSGDIVMTMGAGDVTEIWEMLHER
ncbi:MAG: cyanophycin synthetase [bacterium]|nr:cyanophycin synthetase [bacterium]